MGSRNQYLEYVAFNDKTIYHIISELPYRVESLVYDSSCNKDIYGQEKLTRVLTLIQRQRQKVHARSTDRANMDPVAHGGQKAITKETNLVVAPNPQGGQATHPPSAAATQAAGTVKQARFTSWKELCKGASHSYPTVDDVFNTVSTAWIPPWFSLASSLFMLLIFSNILDPSCRLDEAVLCLQKV
jgi:hypothetical protein